MCTFFQVCPELFKVFFKLWVKFSAKCQIQQLRNNSIQTMNQNFKTCERLGLNFQPFWAFDCDPPQETAPNGD